MDLENSEQIINVHTQQYRVYRLHTYHLPLQDYMFTSILTSLIFQMRKINQAKKHKV